MNDTSLDHIDQLILVAGLAGAGKSSALDILEDLGFYAIDNLPVPLFTNLLELSRSSSARFGKTALLLDLESKENVAVLQLHLKKFPTLQAKRQILFLDCETARIIRRYNETRRPHPGFDPKIDKTLADAVERQREVLAPIKDLANILIDTTGLNIHDLKREIKSFVDSLGEKHARNVRVNFISFGYKYGVPLDCDLLIDVRFLKNPYFVDELRDKTGLDSEVQDYIAQSLDSKEFLEQYSKLLNFLLPRYVFEGKSYLNIGIGCTGGRHRSVALAEQVAAAIDQKHYFVSVKHRDINKSAGFQKE